jgi:hypothetical protein
MAADDRDQHLIAMEARLARLEARESVLAMFNSYLYLMDVGYPDELIDLFDADATLHLVNFPPGSGQDQELHGHAEIGSLYRDHTTHDPQVHGGHHTANVGISVDNDAGAAELSAYFLTSGPGKPGAQGGQYRVRLQFGAEGWHICEMQIVSGWGWRPEGAARTTGPVPAAAAWSQGRPVTWGP